MAQTSARIKRKEAKCPRKRVPPLVALVACLGLRANRRARRQRTSAPPPQTCRTSSFIATSGGSEFKQLSAVVLEGGGLKFHYPQMRGVECQGVMYHTRRRPRFQLDRGARDAFACNARPRWDCWVWISKLRLRRRLRVRRPPPGTSLPSWHVASLAALR